LWASTENLFNVTTVAANAARDSANAAIAAERARFHVVIEETNFDWVIRVVETNYSPPIDDDAAIESPAGVNYRFRNYGKTPGIIKEISMGMSVAPDDPIDPVYTVLLSPIKEHMIAGGEGQTSQKSYLMYRALSMKEARAIRSNEARLWFFGRIDYDDVFGSKHTHRFYFRSVTSGDRCFLQSYDYKHYNQST